MQDIGLFWQLTIKTIDDLRIVGAENLTLEMFIMQLVHLKNIETKTTFRKNEDNKNLKQNLIGENIKEENIENDFSTQVKNQLKNTNQIKTNPIKNFSQGTNNLEIKIKSFQDLIEQAKKDKEIELRYDLERNVKLVSFNKGKIDISFNEKLNKNFIKTLTEKLLHWTGERWIISLSKNSDAKSIYEQNLEQNINKLNVFKKTDLAKKITSAFPDAKLIEIIEDNND
jgi:DNA polymerase-3 subunit gamma/tau